MLSPLRLTYQQGGAEALHRDPIVFYQAADSTLTFLHSINTRCLKEDAGCFEGMPETVAGVVVDIERLTLDADTRWRLKQLRYR